MPEHCRVLLAAFAVGASLALAPTGADAAEDGQAIFAQNCAACHQLTGKGVAGAFPALAGSKLATGPQAGPVDRVLNGHGGMPSFKASLSDEQIAAVLTYVRASFGNHAAKITPEVVAKARGGVQAKPELTKMQAH
jgi:mono/diheme cytochrome c family protein